MKRALLLVALVCLTGCWEKEWTKVRIVAVENVSPWNGCGSGLNTTVEFLDTGKREVTCDKWGEVGDEFIGWRWKE